MAEKDTTEQCLDLLTRAIVHLYKSDGTKPSLVISYLPFDKVFYVSICRYNPKTVVFKTHNVDLQKVFLRAKG